MHPGLGTPGEEIWDWMVERGPEGSIRPGPEDGGSACERDPWLVLTFQVVSQGLEDCHLSRCEHREVEGT